MALREYDYLTWTGGGEKLSIAMVCDFFHPNVGGVETHIYSLSQCLIRRGHRVCVITHSYEDGDKQRQGIRYLARGLKVYYVPLASIYKQVTMITLYGNLPIVREILLREEVDVVHGHSSFALLSHETILHAQALGIRTVFTDHSLFGFAQFQAIFTNKLLECVLTAVDNLICVSHTSKENTVLRTKIDPTRVYVIPNALDASQFEPNVAARDLNFVTIVLVSRLVYRKGIDLLVAIIPSLCAIFPQVRFIIGGDGPKRLDLEELRERHALHDRVELLGALSRDQVHGVLIKGDIFLNISLIEAFCIALLEAVSCGLLVVSTAVGGVVEVLPPEFVRLTSPRASDLAKTITVAVQEIYRRRHQLYSSSQLSATVLSNGLLSDSSLPNTFADLVESEHDRAWRMHRWVRSAYSWPAVARRTELVYAASFKRETPTFGRILKCFSQRDGMTGPLLVVLALIHRLFLYILGWLRPAELISKVPHLHWPIEDDTVER